jgi:ABC-type cobalt transport system substrate-binding protein
VAYSKLKKEMNKRIVIGAGVALIVVVIGLYVILPYLFVGPATPLFSIYNDDQNASHQVFVKIVNPDNDPIFKELYELAPGENVDCPKPVYLKILRPKGEYRFEITLDTEITTSYETTIYPHLTVVIELYHRGDPTEGVQPVRIGAVVV